MIGGQEDGADPTAVVPAPTAGARWFNQRLADFAHALTTDEAGRPRSAQARQVLAAAAHELIARVSIPRLPQTADPTWPRDAALQPDQVLANTFEVRAMLSSGGIGQVFRVRHRDLQTDHVVKVLHPRHVLDPALAILLVEEARLLARIHSRGVVGSPLLLRDGDGRMLLAMEYVRGCTLAARLTSGKLSLREVLALGKGLLAALGAVHEAGLVHNDLAPDNVILRDDDAGAPVLIDFGLAASIDEADGAGPIELDFAGKLSWVPPERLSRPATAADPRSDLYALGLVLAAASAGRRLPMGKDRDAALQARLTVPALDSVPAELHPVLTALLQPDPRQRPPDHAATAALLAEIVPPADDRAARSFIQKLTAGARRSRGQADMP